MSAKIRLFWSAPIVLFLNGVMFATTPIIKVASPTNGSTSTSPVHFEATATSSACANGVSAMRVYSGPEVSAYTVAGGSLNAYINLNTGTYDTTVVAWDYCGGTTTVNINVVASGQKAMGGFLYTVNSAYDYGNHNGNNIVGFSIVASNGALAPLVQGAVNTNIFPQSVTSDKGGYRLYVGDYESGDVFGYFIDRDNGYLTPVPGAPAPVNRSVTAVAVHPSGDYVYAAASEQAPGDGIAVFHVQSDGSLSEISGSPFATEIGPEALTVDPGGNYLYVADYSNYVEAFRINGSTGALTAVSGSPYSIFIPASCNAGTGATVNPTEIIDPFGTSVYTPDDFIGYISGWSISSSNGTLNPMSGSPFVDNGGCANDYNGGPAPYSLAVDGTGKFLYVSNTNMSENISIYSIGANGVLTFVNSFTTDCDGFATPIRTDAKGNYLYTAGCGKLPGSAYGLISGYSINHTNGALTVLPGSPFVYAETAGDFTIDSFTVTP
jgi:6-phosphogluconolactonase